MATVILRYTDFGQKPCRYTVSSKNRASARLLAKISVSQVFWDPIKNRVSPRSALLEAVYLKALLYFSKYVRAKFSDPLEYKKIPRISEDYCEKVTFGHFRYLAFSVIKFMRLFFIISERVELELLYESSEVSHPIP